MTAGGAAFGSVTIDWTIVGDAGNTADGNGYGAVGYEFSIGTYEVTNAQYAAFLSAVAATDTNNLYNESMGNTAMGGINRTGGPGSYVYAVKSGHENLPVVYVSVMDAMRFTNWLHNGMGSGDTESGAYDLTLNQGGLTARSSGAEYFLPNAHEWYKAAYYDGNGGYYDYATQSNVAPISAPPPDSTITGAANYFDVVSGTYAVTGEDVSDFVNINYLAPVGSYVNSASYYGTFDQNGNVWEWVEEISGASLLARTGGTWVLGASDMQAGATYFFNPNDEDSFTGFRIATSIVPEPGRAVLIGLGLLTLVCRRRRALKPH